MESYNYKRVYSLTVGKPPVYMLVEHDPDSRPTGEEFDVVFSNQNYRAIETSRAVEVRDLQIRAKVTSSSESSGESSKTVIKITNLPEERIKTMTQPNSFIILKGGYEHQLSDEGSYDSLPIIFSGQVSASHTDYEGETDIVTTLICREGVTPAKVSLSLPPSSISNTSVSYKDVFDLAFKAWKDNGIAVSDDLIDISQPNWLYPVKGSTPEETTIDFGWSYEGFLTDLMDDICSQFNYTWYIDSSILYVHSKRSKSFTKSFLLEEDQVIEIKPADGDSRKIPADTQLTRLKIKTLLDGRLTMGSKVTVNFGEYKGTYSTLSVNRSLDFRGRDWYNEVIVEAV